jgi:hypothetical protein
MLVPSNTSTFIERFLYDLAQMFTVVRWSAKFRSLWSRSEKAVKVQGKKA